MTKVPRHASAFTLIELLISVSLLLMLTGLLIAGYNKYNSSQTVTQAAETFKNNVRAIRTNARSGLKPEGCDTLVGYDLQFPNLTSYTSVARCIVGGTEQSLGVESVYTLPPGVSFSSPPPDVMFYTANQGTMENVLIEIAGATNSEFILLSPSGAVGEYVPTPTP